MSENEKPKEVGNAVENLLGNLSLGVVFRHFVSGAFFVGSFLFAKGKLSTWKDLDQIYEHAMPLGLVSLICGSLIYAVHRSITNPVLEALRHYARCFLIRKKCFPLCLRRLIRCLLWCIRGFFMPPRVMSMMFERWKYCQSVKPQASHIYEWGDYVHLLYTTGLAVWLGSVAAHWFPPKSNGTLWDSKAIFLVGGIFMFAGFYTDCRKHIVERRLYRMKRSEDKT